MSDPYEYKLLSYCDVYSHFGNNICAVSFMLITLEIIFIATSNFTHTCTPSKYELLGCCDMDSQFGSLICIFVFTLLCAKSAQVLSVYFNHILQSCNADIPLVCTLLALELGVRIIGRLRYVTFSVCLLSQNLQNQVWIKTKYAQSSHVINLLLAYNQTVAFETQNGMSCKIKVAHSLGALKISLTLGCTWWETH